MNTDFYFIFLFSRALTKMNTDFYFYLCAKPVFIRVQLCCGLTRGMTRSGR